MRNDKKSTEASRKRFAPLDGVIIAVLVSAAVLIALLANSAESDGLEVVVKKDSQVIYTAKLDEIDGSKEICIDEEYHVIILLDSDGVSVAGSDCEDKVCVNTGKLDKPGQAIVCLPAHIAVELKGESSSQLDGVVG